MISKAFRTLARSEDFRSIYKNAYRPARNWVGMQAGRARAAAGPHMDNLSSRIAGLGDRVTAGFAAGIDASKTGGLRSYAYGGGGGAVAGGVVGGAYGVATGQEGGFTSGALIGAAIGAGGVGVARHSPIPNGIRALQGQAPKNFTGIAKYTDMATQTALTKPLRSAAAIGGIGWAGTAIGTTPVNRLRRA